MIRKLNQESSNHDAKVNETKELVNNILNNFTDKKLLSNFHVEKPTRTLFHRILELPTPYYRESMNILIAELAKINKNSKLVRIYVFNALETGQVSNVDKILRECPELAIPVFKMIGSEQMSSLLQSSEISRKSIAQFNGNKTHP